MTKNESSSRRDFVKKSTLSALAVFSADLPGVSVLKRKEIPQGIRILFQGDSITDGNRGRSSDPNHIMGHGYAFSIASRVGTDFAVAKPVFYNKGISGNTIEHLNERWQTDAVDLNPDVLSVLVGINDVGKMVRKGSFNTAYIDSFERGYRRILTDSRKKNPALIIVLCLPFVYPVGKIIPDWEKYHAYVAALKKRILLIAKDFDAQVVDFSGSFEKAFKNAPMEYWVWDGIHPTVSGHELLARQWIKAVSSKIAALSYYKY